MSHHHAACHPFAIQLPPPNAHGVRLNQLPPNLYKLASVFKLCAFVSSSGSVSNQVLHVNGLVLPRPPEPGPSAAAAAAALAPRAPPLAVAFEKRRAHYANGHITYCLGDAVETFGLTGKEVQELPRKQARAGLQSTFFISQHLQGHVSLPSTVFISVLICATLAPHRHNADVLQEYRLNLFSGIITNVWAQGDLVHRCLAKYGDHSGLKAFQEEKNKRKMERQAENTAVRVSAKSCLVG